MYTTIEAFFAAHMLYRNYPHLLWENVSEWTKKGWEKSYQAYLANDGLTHYPGWSDEQAKKAKEAVRPKRVLNE